MTKNIPECPTDSTHEVIRFGTYERNNGSVTQYFYCKDCKRKFRGGENYEGSWYPTQRVIETLTYYYNGQSYGNIAQTFNDLYRERISKETLWRWLIQFTLAGIAYVETLRPRLGKVWVADETAIFINGKQWWLWDIIDEKTRYLVATHLSKTRGTKKAAAIMELAKKRSAVIPDTIRTDKLADYRLGIQSAFGRDVVHLTSHGFDSDTNINLIERFHGTVKQRTKVMRHFKIPVFASITLDGFTTHYNFLKEHETLHFKTPATVAGVGIEIQNWGDLIHNGLAVLERSGQADGFLRVASNPQESDYVAENLIEDEW